MTLEEMVRKAEEDSDPLKRFKNHGKMRELIVNEPFNEEQRRRLGF